MKRLKPLLGHRNLWIGLALLVANAFAWIGTAAPVEWPECAPRLDPEIAAIREKLWSGKAVGENFSIQVSDEMACEAVSWFLKRHPEVPFSHPQVHFGAHGVTGDGLAHVLGLRTEVHGRAGIRLQDGRPVVKILELGIAGATAPDFVLGVIQSEIEAQFNLSERLPVEISHLEMGDGFILVEGQYR